MRHNGKLQKARGARLADPKVKAPQKRQDLKRLGEAEKRIKDLQKQRGAKFNDGPGGQAASTTLGSGVNDLQDRDEYESLLEEPEDTVDSLEDLLGLDDMIEEENMCR